MSEPNLSLSAGFPDATEDTWLAAVQTALKGKDAASLERLTGDGLSVRPLYRESDFAGSRDPRGVPGAAPFLRGATASPDPYLPWDIRQRFSHPLPPSANPEILRDLERGVSSIELEIDPSGAHGIQLTSLADYNTTLNDVRADIAAVALSPLDDGVASAALLAMWADGDQAAEARLDFNMDPVGALARTGVFDTAAVSCAGKLMRAVGKHFPRANFFRFDARVVHEAGGTDAQELAFLIASAIDTLRRLDAEDVKQAADRSVFALAVDANYGIGIAKLRAARRLWARCREALKLEARAMRLQAVTSARMLTRNDPWTNILRNTAAAFAGATGGADIVTVRAFNEALGRPEELGRRIARNTQIIAMEESQLGRVADPMGGAWFSESFAEDLSAKAWSLFQDIEREGGLVESLRSGALQGRVAAAAAARAKDIGKRKIAITGVSEFPLLEEIEAPAAPVSRLRPLIAISNAALAQYGITRGDGARVTAAALVPVNLAAAFETLRAAASAATKKPTVFLATLGTLSDYSARTDFARNLFAAGGIKAVEDIVAPKSADEAVVAFRASGAKLVCICSSDARYTDGAAPLAQALKAAGATRVFLAGRLEAASIDTNVYVGADVLHVLKLAHAELGI